MNDTTRIKASIISGVMEVGVTHPLDYIKTVLQSRTGTNKNSSIRTIKLLKTPYKGITSKLLGTIPMRILFWCSLDNFNNKGYSPITSAFFTSIIQTTIDYPIEQIKTQKMIHNKRINQSFKNINFYGAILPHLFRNISFAITVNCIIQSNPDSNYHGAIGGFIGSIISQPLDNIKTYYQSGNISFPTHWKFKNYMVGWNYRASVSLLSMNVGWVTYHKVKCLL